MKPNIRLYKRKTTEQCSYWYCKVISWVQLLATSTSYLPSPTVCQQTSSYTLRDRKKCNVWMYYFLIVLQKWIPVAASKNGSRTLGFRFSARVNWHSSFDVSGICIYTSWHLDAHLEKSGLEWSVIGSYIFNFFVLCSSFLLNLSKMTNFHVVLTFYFQ